MFFHIEDLPEDIINQAKIGLPLTDRQIATVFSIKKEYDKKVQTKRVLEQFSDAQKTVYKVLPRWKKEGVVQRFIDREGFDVKSLRIFNMRKY